ncbi:MAG: tRNA dihydrouridine synthase DusB [Phyllobacteriaceae bacterium]|jgi:nifR3 family TIM-barrel protein|nr:tRNA dihydrouridine synthase DusB [Phyllobacteriaceae bacterium]
MSMSIGSVRPRNPVFLAPMSGVTDEAFRLVAHAHGAGLVVSEMVASDALAQERPDMVRRARGKAKISPFVMQLAGREAKWMAEGARLAQDLGADVIDINMGCPARQVTGGLSGSALMRDPDHAVSLIEATVKASQVPVTVKMRLGWDHSSLNAPDLARRAEQAGAQMITVHGRTRCMFYSGKADWSAIRAVKDAISIPLVANGDGETAADARAMMDASGADAVMFGRSCYGRPWWPGVVADQLAAGTGRAEPSLAEEVDIMLWHQDETLKLYGAALGNKTFRKHLGWTLARLELRGLMDGETQATARAALLSSKDNGKVAQGIRDVYARILDEREAA